MWTSEHAVKPWFTKKYENYVDLREEFLFIPVATETSEVLGKQAIKLIKAIETKITEVTHEEKGN